MELHFSSAVIYSLRSDSFPLKPAIIPWRKCNSETEWKKRETSCLYAEDHINVNLCQEWINRCWESILHRITLFFLSPSISSCSILSSSLSILSVPLPRVGGPLRMRFCDREYRTAGETYKDKVRLYICTVLCLYNKCSDIYVCAARQQTWQFSKKLYEFYECLDWVDSPLVKS